MGYPPYLRRKEIWILLPGMPKKRWLKKAEKHIPSDYSGPPPYSQICMNRKISRIVLSNILKSRSVSGTVYFTGKRQLLFKILLTKNRRSKKKWKHRSCNIK